ncbi:hypothetical protein NT6N_13650 [Oceaniferula spumae]|uniref:HEAT repeat domain-containing protein n=1 Tax=Oceaniferula spumae TaxID=2979115 RepID=A0AAT9FJZ4_9BACT
MKFIAILTSVIIVVVLLIEPNFSGHETRDKDKTEQDSSSITTIRPSQRITNILKNNRQNNLTEILSDEHADIKSWLDSIPRNKRDLILNETFKELQVHVMNTGDYTLLLRLMNHLTNQEARNLMIWVIGVKSILGLKHDVVEQIKLVNHFKDGKSIIFERKVYHEVGAKRLDDLAQSPLLGHLDQEQFLMVCHGAVKEGFTQGVKAVSLANDEATKRAAASFVMRQAMRQNSMKASNELVKLPVGIIRDEATASLIGYLAENGSLSEAKPWLKEIRDPVAKQRAEAVLNVKE